MGNYIEYNLFYNHFSMSSTLDQNSMSSLTESAHYLTN